MLLSGSTSAGVHDILIGVKAATGATNDTWTKGEGQADHVLVSVENPGGE